MKQSSNCAPPIVRGYQRYIAHMIANAYWDERRRAASDVAWAILQQVRSKVTQPK